MFKFLILVSCVFALAFALPTGEKEKSPALGYPGYGLPGYPAAGYTGYGRGYWSGYPAAGYTGYLGGYAGYPGITGYPYGVGYENYGYGRYYGQY